MIEFTRLSPHTTRDRKLGDKNEAWLALSVVSAVSLSQQWPGSVSNGLDTEVSTVL